MTRDPEYLSAIFERSADGLMLCDGQGRILKLNRAAERLNGIRARDVLGRDVKTLLSEGRLNRSATQEALETRRQVSLVQTTPHSGHTLLVTSTPVFDPDGEISFVVVNERDISLIESMRQELQKVRKASEKMRDELAELALKELEENQIVAESPSMQQTLHLAMKLARIDASNILIQGESGTGKGLVSKFIHKNGLRSHAPFIQINCAALPESLLEAELFGYARGAFTGARESGKAGLFELAEGGTLFLDEIGELSPGVQAKLLKYLDDHEIMPLGGTRARKIDCAVIAATNRDLEERTQDKKFRLDLLHRLNTFTLTIPPLRERPEDIQELVCIYLARSNKKYRRTTYIGNRGYAALKSYAFPGNVRELINTVKQAVVMCDKKFLDDYLVEALAEEPAPSVPSAVADGGETLKAHLLAAEYELLARAASYCTNTREAAAYLEVSQPTVVRKFKKHGIRISDY